MEPKNEFEWEQPILALLRLHGVEPDQRLGKALEIAACEKSSILDSHVFHALLRLHSFEAWQKEIEQAIEGEADHYRKWLWLSRNTSAQPDRSVLEHATANISMQYVLSRALQVRRDPRTLGSNDFLRAISLMGAEYPRPKSGINLPRPHTVDLLCQLLDGERHLDLHSAPQAAGFLNKLTSVGGPDDFQILLSMQEDRVVVRPYSVLGDYVMESDAGVLSPKRGLITHFKDLLCAFTEEEISELEALLNNPRTDEGEFQVFFERHPHFFRRWDYREVHPHVVLQRDEGDLIPDFLLTDRDAQKAAIVELKLPTTVVRRQRNRDRFAASVMEARAQLLRYRDWFEESRNRKSLMAKIGLEVFRPRLAVIIGRSSDFVDGIDRQRLNADNPDLELVTYDDMLLFAKRRRFVLDKIS